MEVRLTVIHATLSSFSVPPLLDLLSTCSSKPSRLWEGVGRGEEGGGGRGGGEGRGRGEEGEGGEEGRGTLDSSNGGYQPTVIVSTPLQSGN